MTVTMDEVIEVLDVFEPHYDKAALLGPEALPHLEVLVKNEDLVLASKAAYLASLIQDERSLSILRVAAQSRFPQVRYSVASGSRNLRIHAVDDLLDLLKNDEDSNVRKRALTSMELRNREKSRASED